MNEIIPTINVSDNEKIAIEKTKRFRIITRLILGIFSLITIYYVLISPLLISFLLQSLDNFNFYESIYF